jgi:hypothetical protein
MLQNFPMKKGEAKEEVPMHVMLHFPQQTSIRFKGALHVSWAYLDLCFTSCSLILSGK